MDLTLLEPSAPYEEVDAALKTSETALVEICMQHLKVSPNVTCANLYGLGIGRRAMALSSGYRTMVDQRNSLCALPIVRMQLDTALRLYAGFFVSDSLKFSEAVLNGAQVNKMKSGDGDLMHDGYLRDRVAKRNPWMTDVYRLTSGYIHFSSKHITEIFRPGEEERELTIVIGPNDKDREAKDFHEPSRCMHHLNLIIGVALKDWFARMCGPGSTGVVLDPQEAPVG